MIIRGHAIISFLPEGRVQRLLPEIQPTTKLFSQFLRQFFDDVQGGQFRGLQLGESGYAKVDDDGHLVALIRLERIVDAYRRPAPHLHAIIVGRDEFYSRPDPPRPWDCDALFLDYPTFRGMDEAQMRQWAAGLNRLEAHGSGNHPDPRTLQMFINWHGQLRLSPRGARAPAVAEWFLRSLPLFIERELNYVTDVAPRHDANRHLHLIVSTLAARHNDWLDDAGLQGALAKAEPFSGPLDRLERQLTLLLAMEAYQENLAALLSLASATQTAASPEEAFIATARRGLHGHSAEELRARLLPRKDALLEFGGDSAKNWLDQLAVIGG